MKIVSVRSWCSLHQSILKFMEKRVFVCLREKSENQRDDGGPSPGRSPDPWDGSDARLKER